MTSPEPPARSAQVARLVRAVAEIRAAIRTSDYFVYRDDPAVKRAQAVLVAARRNATAADLAAFDRLMGRLPTLRITD